MSYDFTDLSGMDEAECQFITDFCIKNNIKYVLEFGPGNSTQALIDGGVETITAFEQDAAHAEAIRIMFPSIRIMCYDPSQMPITTNYGSGPFALKFDMALIDGPTELAFTPSRLNSSLYCFPRADRIMIHDTTRDATAFKVLEDIGMTLEDFFPSKRGLAVLRKYE